MELEKLIKSPFEIENFKTFVSQVLGLDTKKIHYTNITDDLEYTKIVEDGCLSDNSTLDIVVLKTQSNILNARVKYNNYLETIAKNNSLDLALMAIYNENDISVWKLSLVVFDNNQAVTTSKRYTFELGAIPHKTALQQLIQLDNKSSVDDYLEAFGVEKISDSFFDEYKELYFTLVQIINPQISIFEEGSNNPNSSLKLFVKKLLGRIVFLYFLQKKGWLGSDDDWENGDKEFLKNCFNKKYMEYENFYSQLLDPIFFDALNEKRKDDYFSILKCRMPFLNGGLFSPTLFDRDNKNNPLIILDNEIFAKIFKIFDSYNFTIVEDTPHDSEVAIDPEMLGRVFENLLEDKKDSGTFYTPREIVHYISKMSIDNYLETKAKKYNISLSQDELNKAMIKELKDIKVLDPAIGSGAFPMGILHEIIEARVNLGDKISLANMKREIIENSIYGIDIEQSAVEIAKLRFWLSIVVDEKVQKGDSPKPLPNLDYKIMIGNSLVESVNGFNPLDKKTQNTNSKKELKLLENKFHNFFNITSKKEKEKLKREIDTHIKNILISSTKNFDTQQTFGEKTKKEMMEFEETYGRFSRLKQIIKEYNLKGHSTELFFYDIYFREVMQDGGFDLVVGNPPYIDYRKIDDNTKQGLTNYYSYKISKTGSIYIYFIEKGIELLKDDGVLSYINPYQYFSANAGVGIRKYLFKHTDIMEIIDISDIKVFKSASTYTCINTFKKASSKKDTILYKPLDVDNLLQNKQLIEYKTIKDSQDYKIVLNRSSIVEKLDKIPTKINDYVDIFCGTSKSGFRKSVISMSEYEALDIKHRDNYLLFVETSEIARYEHSILKAIEKDIYSNNVHKKMANSTEHLFLARMTKHIRVSKSKGCEVYVGKVNVLTNTKLNINYILAILNSKLINYYYFTKNESKHLSGGYQGFDIPSVKEIPIHVITDTSPFESLVEDIMTFKEQEKDTTVLEAKIDMMVYKLYNLSAEEIDLVENNF